LGLDYFQRRADEIRKVTLKQANGAARKYIRPEHLVMGLAGEVG
jgi:predicted Zn-dependent peptidase